MTAFIVIGAHARGEADIESYGGHNDAVIIDKTDNNNRLGVYLKQLGIFSSIGEARRNNWDKEIEEGYSHFIIGKLKHQIHVLKVASAASYEN